MNKKSLRNIKTEALLVYIRTICEEYKKKIEKSEHIVDLGNEDYNKEINNTILNLNKKLSTQVLSAYELESLLKVAQKEKKEINYQYRALVFYYNVIILELEKDLTSGDKWIPEQIILSLLCEWIFEEEKSINNYPFLKEIEYFKLLGYFEIARNHEKRVDLKENVRNMFVISSRIIKKLNDAKYKINRRRKSKRKK